MSDTDFFVGVILVALNVLSGVANIAYGWAPIGVLNLVAAAAAVFVLVREL